MVQMLINAIFGTKGERGLGLGLQLCMDFVHANGGSISVDSQPGKGTTFRVSLPAAPDLPAGSLF